MLCAGFGTRLRPITNTIPKCLVPINGKILLEYWLDNLSLAGVDEFIINTHYLSKKINDFVKSSKYKNKIILIYEKELLNTAGSILNAKKYLENEESFMVVHSDNLSFCNFKDFIKSHNNKPKTCLITMMTFDTKTPYSCGIVEVDKNNIVKKFTEKPRKSNSTLANGAVYIMDKGIMDFLVSLDKSIIDLSLEVIPRFVNKIYTFHNNIYHRDIGTLEDYSLAQIDFYNFKT